MAKRLLADVLWDAANEHLSPIPGGSDVPGRKMLRFSCNAIVRALRAEGRLRDEHWFPLPIQVDGFLCGMGCDTDAENCFADSDDPQGDRYMWLLLAMHVAEDEGLEL